MCITVCVHMHSGRSRAHLSVAEGHPMSGGRGQWPRVSGCNGTGTAERSYPALQGQGDGREEIPHARGQGRRLEEPPWSEARDGGQGEKPHAQGVVAGESAGVA